VPEVIRVAERLRARAEEQNGDDDLRRGETLCRTVEEGGTVEQFYRGWRTLLHTRERGRAEHSHPGFAPHAHSHIKLVAARQPEGTGTR
jgi:hypothetical protein